MWRAAVIKKIETVGLSTLLGIGAIALSATSVIAYYYRTSTHIPPNMYINSIAVGDLTYDQAKQVLVNTNSSPAPLPVTISVDGYTVNSATNYLGVRYDYDSVMNTLHNSATTGRLRDRLAWRLRPLFSAQQFTAPLTFDDNKISDLIQELNSHVEYKGELPSITLGTSNNPETIKVFAGKSGRVVNSSATRTLLEHSILDGSASISAVVASTSAELSTDEVKSLTERTKKFVGKSIRFTYESQEYAIKDKELVSFLNISTGYKTDLLNGKIASIAAEVNRPPQEPVFEYDKETLAVSKFVPPLNGLTLDESKTYVQLQEALQKIDDTTSLSSESAKVTEPLQYQLAVTTAPPKKTLADTNDLGIKERIGFGDSHYAHSIPNRIHNVAITTQRINDHIVLPGKEFSFNKTLGDVSAETGYKSAYVIMNGQTALGDGGGVCQVSTTLFRSVLNAGLKVTRRLPHSYRVSYYELDSKPGIDATVYAGDTDFRFVNDTPGAILIHTEADSRNLYMYASIYGTSDGRSTEIKDHITWNPRPAPPAEYYPDPTLPAGKLVQIDWAAAGISASFINVIKDKDGKVIRKDKYVSNYRPWSAKYRQGTGT